MIRHDLLTTGEAAEILGCSRQHITDLCRAGRLPYQTVGTHRRIARADLVRFAEPRSHMPGDALRQRLRALWLHRGVAGRLATDPHRVLAVARANLGRARALHSHSLPWIEAWEAIIDDPEQVMVRLTALDDQAGELRQNSPFAGVLDEAERHQILTAFAEWWREFRGT